MCLVAFAWRAHPVYRLVMAANRDEFHERPAAAMDWWPDRPQVLGGRDLEAGGTWLAASRSGRIATVTNYREDLERHHRGRSRGELVAEFVAGSSPALDYCKDLAPEDYAGFSLLACDREHLVYVSNRGDPARRLSPGVYGLSNASLDTPWDKVTRSKGALEVLVAKERLDAEDLFAILADRAPAPSDDYAGTGLAPELARAVSAPFITANGYGTRCSTVLLLEESGTLRLHERRFDANGELAGKADFRFVTG